LKLNERAILDIALNHLEARAAVTAAAD